jgi:hydrogenase-1 operon protein HyaE
MNATAIRPLVEPPLVTQLIERLRATRLEASGFDAFVAGAGHTVLFFTEDPLRVKETLDLAVILPELLAAVSQRVRVGVLPPALANAKASVYGVRRWPALAFLRDGGWLGNVEGLRDWAEYVAATNEVLAGAVRPLPPKVIPVAAAGAPACG